MQEYMYFIILLYLLYYYTLYIYLFNFIGENEYNDFYLDYYIHYIESSTIEVAKVDFRFDVPE